MNILILAYTHRHLKPIMRYTEQHLAQIEAIVPDAQVSVVDPETEAIGPQLATADILIMSPLDHQAIVDFSKAPRLKWVHITAAGATDIAARLKDTDVLLTNSSGVHPVPIAEHVFAFLLMLTRQMHASYRAQLQQKQWVQDGLAPNLSELNGSTLGIVGFGRIGRRVARIAKAFDMRVVALTHSDPALQDANVDTFYAPADVSKLLAESDVVVNCLPLTGETTNFFTADSFGRMKHSAYFINIGRGKTVAEADLIQALKNNRIKGAGLDVFEQEPLPASSELWSLPNVILTPHYAGWTPRYIDRVLELFTANLTAYLDNKPMPTLVDKAKQY